MKCNRCYLENDPDTANCERCGAPFQAGAQQTLATAAWERRSLAVLIDGLVFLPFVMFFMAHRQSALFLVGVGFIPLAYKIFLEAAFGQTLGKRLMKIKVVKIDGKPIGFSQAFLRSLFSLVLVVVGLAYRLGHSAPTDGVSRSADTGQFVLNSVGTVWFMIDASVWFRSEIGASLHDLMGGTRVVYA